MIGVLDRRILVAGGDVFGSSRDRVEELVEDDQSGLLKWEQVGEGRSLFWVVSMPIVFCRRPNGRSRKAGTGRPPGRSYPPQATLMNAELMYIIERKIAMMVGNKRTSEILSSCIKSPLAQLFDLYLL